MSQDPEPYDIRQPFDAQKPLDGFAEEVHEHQVDPDSPIGRAMAEARESWARSGGPPDPADFVFPAPIAVELDDG